MSQYIGSGQNNQFDVRIQEPHRSRAKIEFYDHLLTNSSRVNHPLILAQNQQKMAIFVKTDSWGLIATLTYSGLNQTTSPQGDFLGPNHLYTFANFSGWVAGTLAVF